MTVNYPINLLNAFPGWSTDFDLLYRQEYSRTAGGLTIAKDMGTPLWQASYQTTTLLANDMDVWRARMKMLEGSLKQFWAMPMSRCFPIAYPNGTGIGNVAAVKVESLGTDNKSLLLNGLPIWNTISIGDYIQIGTKLYQVLENAIANASGRTTRFKVRPHLAPGTTAGNIVTLVKPSVPMILVAGSLSSTSELRTGRGRISFQAIESR